MVAAKVEEQPWCTRCGKAGGILDPHEVLPRGRGGSITDPANVVIICRACHNWVTRHASTLAVDEGWSLPSWEKPA
jgi:5-methylcytosine-specific restriction endonuclease McrA